MALDIIGAIQPEGQERNAPGVRFLGQRDRGWIRERLPQYSGLIFPGRVWEGAHPLVVREALEAGVPVVALEGSGAADLVETTGAGSLYRDGDGQSLSAALAAIPLAGDDQRVLARAFALRELTQQSWMDRMLQAYEAAREEYSSRGR
jgi:glycosyltransferase involved in cell wall biosynthesis